MTRCAVLDDFLVPDELATIGAAWPAPGWPGWVHYDSTEQCKCASDLATPIPPALSAVLFRLAGLSATLGVITGLGGDTLADLSLHGSGLHCMGPGSFVAEHLDADTHARLGLARIWSAALFVHPRWERGWGGELLLCPLRAVAPTPGRLVVFDCREARHLVRTVTCPEGVERRSLALFGYAALPGPGLRPRADFGSGAEGPRLTPAPAAGDSGHGDTAPRPARTIYPESG